MLWWCSAALGGLCGVLVGGGRAVLFGVCALAMMCLCALLVGLAVGPCLGMLVFLLYVGGLMVVFRYFLAISPNLRVRRGGGGLWVGVGLALFLSPLVGRAETRGGGLVGGEVGALYREAGVVWLGVYLLIALLGVVVLVGSGQGPLRPYRRC